MSPVPLMRLFREQVMQESGLAFSSFEQLHHWSVSEPAAFWQALWDFEGFESPTSYMAVLETSAMPGARWFPGAQVNYVRHVFRHVEPAHAAGHPAIIAEDEHGQVSEISWPELKGKVASFAVALRDLGVQRGDRVAAYLPNRPDAIIAFLACASLGAIWTVCAPDMGTPAVLDRFSQIEPKVLIATDGVFYAGKAIDRSEVIQHLRESLPSVETLVIVRSGFGASKIDGALDFDMMTSRSGTAVDRFEPEWVPFDHPLWILYSSGTTGKPKALVHGHGGILLNEAAARLHTDLGASYGSRSPGERFHWFSSTGWMLWNSQISGLLGGTTICIYDGSPMGPRDAPDWGVLWRFAARNRITFFGSGAQFYTMCVKSGADFASFGDLTRLRALGSTASPLPAAVQRDISARLGAAGRPDIWWCNSTGGTDICGAFSTGNRELPDAPGKLQCRQLGAAVEAWGEAGNPLIGELGELVCTAPMPNMPLFLWGDADGARYRTSYFDTYPGVWRHGDWLKIEADGTCEIFGRSDATINRGGHRMGTSEIYAAIEQLDEVADSLVIDVRVDDADSKLLLFVVPTEGSTLAGTSDRIRAAIRTSLSPRFLPDRLIEVTAVPRTLSSKKQELPIKRLFEGAALERVIDPATMSNPECLAQYRALAADFQAGG
jgi:acetoacetyl-CoA synthetase